MTVILTGLLAMGKGDTESAGTSFQQAVALAAEPAAQAGEAKHVALERDVCERWQEFAVEGLLSLQVGMTTATAQK